MPTAQTNGSASTKNSTKNNGGSIIRGGKQSLLSSVPIQNTVKPAGSFAVINDDTNKIFNNSAYPNLKNEPIIFGFTEDILGGHPIHLSNPSSYHFLFSPPNQLIDLTNNNIIINQNTQFNIITLVNGQQILIKPEDVEYFMSTLKINKFEKLCKDTRLQNELPIYADPHGDEDLEVSHQWRGTRWHNNSMEVPPVLHNPCDYIYWGRGPSQGLVQAASDPISKKVIDNWLNVQPVINCYIYYTHKRTNIFLPGYGWKGTPCWGGHLCDKTELDVYIKIWNKYFTTKNNNDPINFSNIEPITNDDNIKKYIQNPTPHDRFFHITIPIDGDYKNAFLENRIKCNGSTLQNPEGGIIDLVTGSFQMFARSGINHAPNFTVFLTLGAIGDKQYLLNSGNTTFVPSCNPPIGTNIIGLCSSFMHKFDSSLEFPTSSEKIYKIIGWWGGTSSCEYINSEANSSCTPEQPQCLGWSVVHQMYADFDENLLPSNLWTKQIHPEGHQAYGKLIAPNDINNPKVIQFFQESEMVRNLIGAWTEYIPEFGPLDSISLCCTNF